MPNLKRISLFLWLLCSSLPVFALDWSDTQLSFKYGTRYAEPYNQQHIAKSIYSLTHANGYRYGSNYLTIDYLSSNSQDPARGSTATGADEVYALYRHTLDLGRLLDTSLSAGPLRGIGLTAGVDWNNKNDNYGSKKRMFVIGPTLMLDTPGMLNLSLLALYESNAPNAIANRYTYATHTMLNAVWNFPFNAGSVPANFEGYANFIAAKGKNEFGGNTAAETNLVLQLMFDASALAANNKIKVGIEYQYWKNKFGNPSNIPGSLANTPMLRAEYHF
ncbi:MAG: hypothetical protein WCK93_06570 [Nitrosomonadales bacterium]|jgi:hypothetical protein